MTRAHPHLHLPQLEVRQTNRRHTHRIRPALLPRATEAYRVALAVLQRPALALDLLLSGATLEAWPRVAATPDPTDLLALPAAYLIGHRAQRPTNRRT